MVNARRVTLVFAALASMAATAGYAQQLPSGSYKSSCTNIRMVDGTLEADCRLADQSVRSSALPSAHDCGADISNENGRLTCKKGAAVRQTSAMRDGYATFGDICGAGQGSEFLMIRWSGSTDDVRRFVFDGHTKVHVFLPKGSTVAAGCGGFAKDKPFIYKTLDG